MGEWIVALSGTPAGETLAVALALLSAISHAIFGAINKGGMDPYLNRGAINVSYSVMAAPFALFVFPWPNMEVFQVLILTYFVHLAYEWLQTTSFAKGAFTVVYPIARGTGPLITAIGAFVIFGEQLGAFQWVGLLVLSTSIFLLALVNYQFARKSKQDVSGLREAVTAAFFTGCLIAVYTTIDAYGVRLALNPFTYLAWFFMMGGFGFPIIATIRWCQLKTRPQPRELIFRGFFGALIGVVSFGSIILATRLGKVAEAATLRETSIIFATIIGVLFLKEKLQIRALALISIIAIGAMMVSVRT